eukprot:7328382-Alexandrium_andersonii.AAC.2
MGRAELRPGCAPVAQLAVTAWPRWRLATAAARERRRVAPPPARPSRCGGPRQLHCAGRWPRRHLS